MLRGSSSAGMPGSGGSFGELPAEDARGCDAAAVADEPCGAEQLAIMGIEADSISAAAVTAVLLNIGYLGVRDHSTTAARRVRSSSAPSRDLTVNSCRARLSITRIDGVFSRKRSGRPFQVRRTSK